MTIKKRFLFTYIGGILIASASLLIILGVVFYLITSLPPTPNNIYKSIAKQRILSEEEQFAYVNLRSIAKTNPDDLLNLNENLKEEIKIYEENAINFVIKKGNKFIYFSNNLVEKSLVAHFPKYDNRNLETKGTIDNNGSFYRYIKFDFAFDDQSEGTIMILKEENNLLDFISKWGILIILSIFISSLFILFLLNHSLNKSIIIPINKLSFEMHSAKNGDFLQIKVEDKKTSKEIKKLFTDFNEMQYALLNSKNETKKLEKNRKELIASISHDLKTPMTSIIGYVEGLIDGVAKEPQKNKQYLNTIHEKSISLNNMIDTLFLYSKLDANALIFHFEKVDLTAFINHIIEEYQLQEKNITFNFKQNSEMLIYADRLHLNRAIYNLLDNSIKYSANRSLVIDIKLEQINKNIVINFKDNGIGIEKNELEFVFDTFYRIDKSRSSLFGSGLGLAIVKQIITAHNGNICIDSIKDVQTSITITLPKYKEINHEN